MLVFGENVLWLLVLIGVMIMIHELGHFWAARFFDVKVEAFSFGFGPRLFGFRRGDTDYRFSLILLGGYFKMAGNAIRMSPPLNISKADVDEAIRMLDKAFAAVTAAQPATAAAR